MEDLYDNLDNGRTRNRSLSSSSSFDTHFNLIAQYREAIYHAHLPAENEDKNLIAWATRELQRVSAPEDYYELVEKFALRADERLKKMR